MPEATTNCGICAGIAQIKAGNFRDAIAELPNSYVILGDAQFYRGYCILFAKRHVTELYLMPTEEARGLFDEVRLVAEGIAAAMHPWKMNYECLGNTEPHVHWHLFPRYENDELRKGPVWLRPEAERKVAIPNDDRMALIRALREQILARFSNARAIGS